MSAAAWDWPDEIPWTDHLVNVRLKFRTLKFCVVSGWTVNIAPALPILDENDWTCELAKRWSLYTVLLRLQQRKDIYPEKSTLLSWRPCFWSNMTSSITQNSNVVSRRLLTTLSAYCISHAYGIQMWGRKRRGYLTFINTVYRYTLTPYTVANPQRGLVWNVNFHLYPTNLFLI
jgi:hypothetical protein